MLLIIMMLIAIALDMPREIVVGLLIIFLVRDFA